MKVGTSYRQKDIDSSWDAMIIGSGLGGLAERMLEPLLRHCPQIEGSIEIVELSTPLSTRHFAGYQRDEIYSLAATPARFAARPLKPT